MHVPANQTPIDTLLHDSGDHSPSSPRTILSKSICLPTFYFMSGVDSWPCLNTFYLLLYNHIFTANRTVRASLIGNNPLIQQRGWVSRAHPELHWDRCRVSTFEPRRTPLSRLTKSMRNNSHIIVLHLVENVQALGRPPGWRANEPSHFGWRTGFMSGRGHWAAFALVPL